MATQDLTTYTEVDDTSVLTVTTDRVTWTNIDSHNDDDHYVVRDFGVGFFSGDFTHRFVVRISAAQTFSFNCMWAMANSAGVYQTLLSANSDELLCGFEGTDILLRELDGGSEYTDSYSASLDTTYYIEIERDETTGTYGTLYARIYSDSGYSTLVDTLSVPLHSSKKDFRYFYAFQSGGFVSGSTLHQTGYAEDFDLNLPTASHTSAALKNGSGTTLASHTFDHVLVYEGDMSGFISALKTAGFRVDDDQTTDASGQLTVETEGAKSIIVMPVTLAAGEDPLGVNFYEADTEV